MKIYYVAHARMPNSRAYGIQLAKMCEAFIESGVELELILPDFRGASKENIQSFYGLTVPVTATYLSVPDFGDSGLAFNIRALFFALRAFWYLKNKNISRDSIVYTIDLDQFSFFLLPLLGCRVFIELHGSKRKNIFNTFFFKRVSGIITVSEAVKKSISTTFSIPQKPSMFFPNGIDLKLFSNNFSKTEVRQKLGLPLDKKIVLYSGRFYDWKGLDIIPDAARRVPDTLIYLVGGSEQELKASGVSEIPENVICAGSKDFKDMPLWLASADFFLLTGTRKDKYSYEETSPMKLFEYGALKRPIIAARTPAIEALVSSLDVIFYEPDNADTLASAIQEANRDGSTFEPMLSRMSDKAQEFSWKKRAEAIITFIK